MEDQSHCDSGLLVCVECGKFAKREDLPCSCGNDELFIVLSDHSLLFFKDAPVLELFGVCNIYKFILVERRLNSK